MKTVFITGGAGFIGSHVVRLFVKNYPNDRIVNVDSLSYAGNLENIQDVQNSSNYFLEKVDIRNSAGINRLFEKYNWVIGTGEYLKDFEKNNITASESPSLEKLYLEYGLDVDGWSLNFDVDVPNIDISLCQLT